MALKYAADKVVLVIIFILVFALIAQGAVIKKTSSGICHLENSSYYSRIKNYTAYSSLQGCLDSGGRVPKGYADRSDNNEEYSRSKFGHGWTDADGDCQDSRQEALIAQSTAPVRFENNDKCRVASGRWISPFTGKIIHDPSVMDIDHVVPLNWAWDHGADKWTDKKRKDFANDPANLLSVEASLNRQKGAKGPDEWLPPANQCEYALRYLRIVRKYDLEEHSHIRLIMQQICGSR